MFGKMTYRPDIDGLRSIAVLSVVIYHAMPSVLPGGFAGVDIFFVISGFLITSIIAHEVESGRFSILNFYDRRIRRIFPAMLAVVLLSTIVGYWLLLPGDYRDYSESAIWALGFLANIHFYENTGYFDALTESMPLLHTWSLAVEEQFYLVWPVFIIGLFYFTRPGYSRFWGVVFGTLAFSLSVCIYLTHVDQKAAFYLPFTRAWELLFGGLVALAAHRLENGSGRQNSIWAMSLAGILLLLGSLILINDDMAFPGYVALFPVLGTTLLIAAGIMGQSPVSRMLSIKPMVWIGKISYSLYLWHWPVLVFYRHYVNGQELTGLEVTILIAISIILAHLSWRFVEQPLRNVRCTRNQVFAGGAAGIFFVGLLAVVVYVNNGFTNRIPESVHKLADRKTMNSWDCPEKRNIPGIERNACVIGADWDEAEHKAVLWGDSHALHYMPLIHEAATSNNVAVFVYFSCPPYLDNKEILRAHPKIPDYSEKCGQEYDEIMTFLENDDAIDFVIVAAAWSIYPPRIHAVDGMRS
jgi:peptidoglycan/LPS O-acetylase OafA/YrhL